MSDHNEPCNCEQALRLQAEVDKLRKFDTDRATRWSAEAMAYKAQLAHKDSDIRAAENYGQKVQRDLVAAEARLQSEYNRGLEDGRKTSSSVSALRAERDALKARVAELENGYAWVTFEEGRRTGAAAERAAIVAWLRTEVFVARKVLPYPTRVAAGDLDGWIADIESGAHLAAREGE